MTAVTFPLRLPRLAFAICGWRWQNDMHEIKYSVCLDQQNFVLIKKLPFWAVIIALRIAQSWSEIILMIQKTLCYALV